MEDPEGPVTAVLNLIAGQDVPPEMQQIQLRGNSITFGRAVANKVVLESLQISRHHASLEFRANTGKWWLKDLSTNGVLLNYRRYPKNDWMELQDMDVIQFIPTGALQYRIRYKHNSPVPTTSSGLMLRTVPTIASQGGSSESTTNSQERQPEEPIELDDDLESDSGSDESVSLLSGVHQDEMFESFDSSLNPVVIQPTATAKKRLFPTAAKSTGEGSRKRTCANSPCKEEDDDEEEEELLELDEDGDSFMRIIKNFKTPPEHKRETSKSPLKSTPVKSKDPLTQLEQIKQDLEYMTAKCRRLEAEKREDKLNYDTIIHEVRSEGENYKNEFHKRIISLLEQDFSCSICSEVFIEATVTDCGHTFCSYCIGEWTKKKTDCPICRKLVTNQVKHIEIENFLTKIHDMMSVEVKMKRTQSLKEREDQQLKSKELETRRRNPEYGFAPDRFVDFLAELQHINDMFGGAHRGQAYHNAGVPAPPGVIPPEINAVAAATRNAVIRRRSARTRNRRSNNTPPQRQAPAPEVVAPAVAQPTVVVVESNRRGRPRSRIAHNVNVFPQIQNANLNVPQVRRYGFLPPVPRVITLDDSTDETAGPAQIVPEPQPGPSRVLNC